MRTYESILIYDPNLGANELKDEFAKLETLITTHGGSSVSIDNWGKKEIPFYIGKHKFGSYICAKFSSDKSDTISHLNSILRISETVLRFQINKTSNPVRKVKVNTRRKKQTDPDFDDFVDIAFDY